MGIFDNVMRVIKLFLFAIIMLAFGGIAYGQSYVNFGMKVPYASNYYAFTNIGLKVTDTVWMPLYAGLDSNWVAGFDAQGKLKLRYRIATDTNNTFATRYWVGQNFVPLTRTINGYPLSSNISLTTTDVPEGTNLYFTQARARQSLSVTGGLLSYDNSTGVIGLTNATLNGSYWALGGNATSSVQDFGTTTAQPIRIKTNNTVRDSIGGVNGYRFWNFPNTPATVIFKAYEFSTGLNFFQYRVGTSGLGVQYTIGNNFTIDVTNASGSATVSTAGSWRSTAIGLMLLNPTSTLILAPATGQNIDFRIGGEAGTLSARVTSAGRWLFNTTTDNLTDFIQVVGNIRATILKATTPNAGATTDNVVVWNSATQEYRNLGAFSVLTQPRDTTIPASGNTTLLSTVRNYHYSFTGTTATWTLPTIASSYSGGNGVTYHIKNRGSGNLTINTAAAGNDIWVASATNTITLMAGDAIILHNDGTYFNVE